jgi:hypothetical protein
MPAHSAQQGSSTLSYQLMVPSMEGQMDNNANEPQSEFGYKPRLEFENNADTAGLWFAAAVIFAVIAAGIIVYRSGISDLHTASLDVASVATTTAAPPSRPVEIPPAYSHIEGIDP